MPLARAAKGSHQGPRSAKNALWGLAVTLGLKCVTQVPGIGLGKQAATGASRSTQRALMQHIPCGVPLTLDAALILAPLS